MKLIYILLLACLGAGCGTPKESIQLYLDANHAYAVLSARMDARMGKLTAAESILRWGQPTETTIQNNYLRAVWAEPGYPFPAVPKPPANTLAMDQLNYAASDGHFDWPINTRLIIWFDEVGHMQRWMVEPIPGSIYHQSTGTQ